MAENSAQIDIIHTRRALELAAQGIGLVSPNPLVGCVIVSAAGEVAGEGAYIYEDVVHAEAVALRQAGERAKGGTAYVSLEPHDHHGKTPPCSLALIEAGIKRVVCPIEDPNPKVSGSGFARLRAAGIKVETGILAEEAAKQNEKFICWHRKKRPFIHLKMAMSLDGRISLSSSISTALTGEGAMKRVHELRHEHDAILVGGNTAAVDNPSLTDRSGEKRRRKLIRAILDNSLKTTEDSYLVNSAQEFPLLIFSSGGNEEKKANLRRKGAEIIELDARNLAEVLRELYSREIQSVLVEGGGEIAGAFCDIGLIDKVSFIYAPLLIGGNAAPSAIKGKGALELPLAIKLRKLEIFRYGNDFEACGYPG